MVRIVTWVTVAIVAGIWIGFSGVLPGTERGQEPASTGVAAIGGPFALTSHKGEKVDNAKLAGRPYLVFFGFTHCPDICPTKLFEISEVLRAAGDGAKAKGLKALFITVDPERDTPDAMKSYLGSFDSRIVGLSGDRPAIDAVIKAYRAYARKVPLKDGDYTMDHTALVYLMGKDGSFVGAFNIEQPPAQAAAEWLRHS